MDSYKVEITETALSEAVAYVAYIRKQSHDDLPGLQWFGGLLSAIETLGNLPARCPLIREKGVHDLPVHELLYASHRIMFSIERGLVTVLRIYHAARRPLRAAHRSPRTRTRSSKPTDKL